MGLFDNANAAFAALESRVSALEAGTVTPPVEPPVDPPVDPPLEPTVSALTYGLSESRPDNEKAIQAAIDANPDAVIGIPAGTFRQTGPWYLRDGVTICGVGRETVLHLTASSGWVGRSYGASTRKHDVGVRSLTMRGTPSTTTRPGTGGFHANGTDGLTLMDLWADGLGYGVMIGGSTDPVTTDALVSRFTAEHCWISLEVVQCTDSLFEHLYLTAEQTEGTGKYHNLYIERGAKRLQFFNVTLDGGNYGYALHMYSEGGSSALSEDIDFDDLTIVCDNPNRGPIVISNGFERVGIRRADITATSPSNFPIINWYSASTGPVDCVVDGFAAVGGKSLHARGASGGYPVGCVISNGTYPGTIGTVSGVSVSGVS